MRAISLFLAMTCVTTTAFAQMGPQPGSTAPGVMTPGQPVVAGTVTAPAATPAGAPTEIGFDSKVKRDPNGKVIDESKTAAPVQAAPQLRNDRKLRGDSSILTQKPAPAPAPQAVPAQNQPNTAGNGNSTAPVNANMVNGNSSIPKLINAPTTTVGTTNTVNTVR